MSTDPTQHRLLAILAADAVGFSAAMAIDDRGTVASLEAARAVFRRLVAQGSGRVVDTAGDSVLAVFDSAGAAVAAALAAQDELGVNGPAPLRFRIGLHLGDVIVQHDGSVYGDGVNVAARLQALAEPGAVVVSQVVRGIVASRVGAVFDDLGEHDLKNLGRQRAYRVRRQGQARGAASPEDGLRFGPAGSPARFELQARERRLLVDGVPAVLGARAFDLLLALVDRAGSLVSKQELLERVWPGLVVEEANLSVQVSSLRKVLGGEIIATIPGRGYRFTAPVRAHDAGACDPASATAPARDLPGSAAPQPAPPTPATLRTNLPSLLTPLIGRDDDLAALHELVAGHRLVTVVGAGGMGKTLLAQHLLTARTSRHTHGVCWVELGPLTDPTQIAPAIAAAVGVPLQGDDAVAALTRTLAPLELLLALDNAEHLLDAVARVVDAVLRAAPGIRVLVTSQARLKLAAERVMRLGTLAVPQGPLPAAEALAFGAVALFVERAQAVDSRFALSDANAPAVIALCSGLDGLALAIELAAARAPLLGVQKLADSLDARLKLLASSQNRHAPQRQQTLRAALEWSHGLLAERERTVFRRLAVIAGSLDLPCVQRIASDEQLDEWAVLDALDILVDRSLVAVVQPEDWPAARYRLLDSPKAFALELLTQAGEVEAVRLRHAQALRDGLLSRDDARLAGQIALAELETAATLDRDDAIEAAQWADSRERRALAVDLLAPLLGAVYGTLSHPTPGQVQWLERLTSDDLSPLQRWRVWVVLQAMSQGPAAKRAALDQARRALDELPPSAERERGLQWWSINHAYVAWTSDDRETARALLREMYALHDPRWLVNPSARTVLAAILVACGDAEQAREAVRFITALPRSEAGISRITLMDALMTVGDYASAIALGRDELAHLAGSRDAQRRVFAQLNLAGALLAVDQVDEAADLLRAGWARTGAFDAYAFDEYVPWYADYLALLAALRGRPAVAARLLGFSDRAYADRDDERMHNEENAFNRARDLATAALGAAEVERLSAEGALLRREDIDALVFGPPA